eukprot:925121-Alexandrium_andersonii.AAC.1
MEELCTRIGRSRTRASPQQAVHDALLRRREDERSALRGLVRVLRGTEARDGQVPGWHTPGWREQ